MEAVAAGNIPAAVAAVDSLVGAVAAGSIPAAVAAVDSSPEVAAEGTAVDWQTVASMQAMPRTHYWTSPVA